MKYILFLFVFFISNFAKANTNCGDLPSNSFGCAVWPSNAVVKYNPVGTSIFTNGANDAHWEYAQTFRASAYSTHSSFTVIGVTTTQQLSAFQVRATGLTIRTRETPADPLVNRMNPDVNIDIVRRVPVGVTPICPSGTMFQSASGLCFPFDPACPNGDCPVTSVCKNYVGSEITFESQTHTYSGHCSVVDGKKCRYSYLSHSGASVKYQILASTEECSVVGFIGNGTPIDATGPNPDPDPDPDPDPNPDPTPNPDLSQNLTAIKAIVSDTNTRVKGVPNKIDESITSALLPLSRDISNLKFQSDLLNQGINHLINNQLPTLNSNLFNISSDIAELGNRLSNIEPTDVTGVESRLDDIKQLLSPSGQYISPSFDESGIGNKIDSSFGDSQGLKNILAAKTGTKEYNETFINKYTGSIGSRTCPPPVEVGVFGLEFKFDFICELAELLSSIILMAAWLKAASIVLVRN